MVQSLTSAGHVPLELTATDGSSALVLPFGGRLLGLFPKPDSNLLWTNPLLARPETAIPFFQAPGWRNTGGGRTWISPERDIHIVNLADPWNTYHVTESIDPGCYSSTVTGQQVSLRTSGFVTNHRTGQHCPVELEKTIRLIPNPLRHQPEAREILTGIFYAGVEQKASLAYAGLTSHPSLLLSLWDAVNLPATGTIVIPTVRKVVPTDFFEATGTSHLHCTPLGLSFVFDGCERHKIAIRAGDLLGGRAGYLRQIAEDEFSLVVRNFFVDPSAEYIDTPWNDPEDRGYVLECYNDGGINGLYGELEYHSPGMGLGTGLSECSDYAQLWGFQGPRNNIRAIMCQLLGEAATGELVG